MKRENNNRIYLVVLAAASVWTTVHAASNEETKERSIPKAALYALVATNVPYKVSDLLRLLPEKDRHDTQIVQALTATVKNKPMFEEKWITRPVDSNIVQVAYVLTKPEFMVGEPIVCEWVLRNVSNKTLSYSFLHPRDFSDVKILSSPTIKRHRHGMPALLTGYFTDEGKLEPGEVKRWPFNLGFFVWFTKRGNYQLQLEGELDVRLEGKVEWIRLKAVQRITVKLHDLEPERFQALMRSMTEKILHGDDYDSYCAAFDMSMIGLPETLPFIKKCMVIEGRRAKYELIND